MRLMTPVSLVMVSLLVSGCLLPTKTTGVSNANRNTVPPVCSVWPEQSFSAKRDSRETVDEIVINNATRNGYCYGSNSDSGVK
jgi:hypothetical protein